MEPFPPSHPVQWCAAHLAELPLSPAPAVLAAPALPWLAAAPPTCQQYRLGRGKASERHTTCKLAPGWLWAVCACRTEGRLPRVWGEPAGGLGPYCPTAAQEATGRVLISL